MTLIIWNPSHTCTNISMFLCTFNIFEFNLWGFHVTPTLVLLSTLIGLCLTYSYTRGTKLKLM